MPDDLPDDAVPVRMLVGDDVSEADSLSEVDHGSDEDGPLAAHGGTHRSPSPLLVGLVALLAALVGVGVVLIYQRATTPGAGSVDVGFMQDMTTHHQQALEMSAVAAEKASDPDVRSFAREILTFQSYEVGYMEALLEDWGQWPFPQDRTAMTWMGMSSKPSEMPGMQTEADIQAMQKATGLDLDARFIGMMIDHHKGGIHMATYAAEHASDPRVRSLAQRMATQQTGEIADFRRAAARLGIPLQ